MSRRVAIACLVSACLLIPGCAGFGKETRVLVATAGPPHPELAGRVRLLESSVRVRVEGSEDVATLEPAAGFFVVHESDLAALLRDSAAVSRALSALDANGSPDDVRKALTK